MTTSFEPLSAKQQVVKIALVGMLLTPIMLIALFWRDGLFGQHFGAVATITILATSIVPVSSRTWIQRIK
jgi:hypothetical protein